VRSTEGKAGRAVGLRPQRVQPPEQAPLLDDVRLLLLHLGFGEQGRPDVAERVAVVQQAAGHEDQLEDEDRPDHPRPSERHVHPSPTHVHTGPSERQRQQHHGRNLGVAHERTHQRRSAKVPAARFAHDPREIVRRLKPLGRGFAEQAVHQGGEFGGQLWSQRLD